MFGLGPTELIIIAIIVLLIFGAKRLPEIGKGLGGAVKELKNVKKQINLEETSTESREEKTDTDKKSDSPSLETKIANKALEQIPGIRRAMNVKKKAEKIKEIIK